MIVKVKFIEMIWDNYQGASGTPIVRSALFDLRDDTRIDELLNDVAKILTIKGIKRTFNSVEKQYPHEGIINIQILPCF